MADNEDLINNLPSIRCRYCGQRNQVRPENGEARCGRCRLRLSDAPHKKFAHLDKDQYIHPADRRALAALRAIPGIDTALKKLLAVTGESAIRVIFTASAVKVTPTQCPDLYAKLQIACNTKVADGMVVRTQSPKLEKRSEFAPFTARITRLIVCANWVCLKGEHCVWSATINR